MKNLFLITFLTTLTFDSLKINAQSTAFTFLPETDYVFETKPTLDGNYISLCSPVGIGPINLNITKINSSGDVIMSSSIDAPEPVSYSQIFSLEDGSTIVMCGMYFLKFDIAGELIFTKEFNSEELGFDPIAGDLDNHFINDIIQTEDGFILLTNASAISPTNSDYFTITKIDESGNVEWSNAYLDDEFFHVEMILNETMVYVTSSNYINFKLTIINLLTGNIESETEVPGDFYTGDGLINTGDGIIATSYDYDVDHMVDILIKYNYDGDVIWTQEYDYSNIDSIGGLINLVKLESGSVLSCNTVPSDLTFETTYDLRYYNTDGDTILQIHNFLDHDVFRILDMQVNENNLIFSGFYMGLFDVDSGFVLITDSLGNFFQLTINGTIYYDENGNGIVDTEEYRFHDRLISTEPNGYYAFTNSEGEYDLHIYEEGEYVLNTETPEYWDIIDPISHTILFEEPMGGDTLVNIDYRLDYTTPIMDLRATLYQQSIRPGFTTYSDLVVENIGNQVAPSVTVYLNHPTELTYIDGTPYSDYTDTILRWDIVDFNPNSVISLIANYEGSVDLEIGESKLFIGTIEPIIGDFEPENNIDSVTEIIVAALDPNHKTVTPSGFGLDGNIDPNTEWLEFTIEFQNIGTASANFVNIVDPIDSDLDLKSIQMLASKHEYWMEITAENTITWHFENINLPDSASDPLGSCGFITYKIKINEEATIGTVITNTAYIYFDYNEAVITNTTKTTLELPNFIQELNNYLNVYPNPAGDYIILQLEEENTSGFNIKIYNINGEVVLNKILDAGNQMIQINSANFPNGIYFINCTDQDGILKTNAKFIVAH